MTISLRPNQFKFAIEGEGVSPDSISLRDLCDVLHNLERAIAATAKVHSKASAEELTVSIVKIGSGSDLITLAASDTMFRSAQIVSKAIATNDFDAIPMPAQTRLRELWSKAKANDWTLRICPDGNGILESAIIPESEILKPGSITGRSTLFGVCERIGGAGRQTLQLLSLSGVRINVTVSDKQLSQEIALHLHKPIGLEGEATWDIDSWSLSEFVADILIQYSSATPPQAFAALAVAAGSQWDEVDPEEYVSELRSD